MKERPKVFRGPDVRAILEGRKVQFREVVKPQPRDIPNGNVSWYARSGEGFTNMPADVMVEMELGPRGTVGDRLWVKEAWQAWRMCSLEYNEWDICDCPPSEILGTYGKPKVEYAASSESVGPWRPSIHMPRWASRIDLEITAVRVERLQDISEEDAIAEGCEREFKPDGSQWGAGLIEAKENFIKLWNSIYGNWDTNPFVWVYEFRRVKP